MMIKKLIIMWAIEAVLDLVIEIGEIAALSTKTEIDDVWVAKLKQHKQVFVKYGKGLL
jgi:hypothetical protein